MEPTDRPRRLSLLLLTLFVSANVIPIECDESSVPTTGVQIKCGSCPCDNPCNQRPPPPPPPPPSPPPPVKNPVTPYCPPPPPPPFLYITGPPGELYPVDTYGFPSSGNRNLGNLVPVFISFGFFWAFWKL